MNWRINRRINRRIDRRINWRINRRINWRIKQIGRAVWRVRESLSQALFERREVPRGRIRRRGTWFVTVYHVCDGRTRLVGRFVIVFEFEVRIIGF